MAKPTTKELILKGLKDGKYAAQMAEELNLSRKTVCKHLNSLEKEGFVRLVNRSSVKTYEIIDGKGNFGVTSKTPLQSKGGNFGGNKGGNFNASSTVTTSYTHMQALKPKQQALEMPLAQYMHRFQRNYTVLSFIKRNEQDLEQTELKNNLQEHGVFAKEDFRITTKTLMLEGLHIYGPYNTQTDIVLKPVAESYADGIANAIASKYGLEIAPGETILFEIEQINHEMTKKIKGKGLIPIHWKDPQTKQEPDLWTDLSFGLRGLESNSAVVLAKMVEIARDTIDYNVWNNLKEISKSNTLGITELKEGIEQERQWFRHHDEYIVASTQTMKKQAEMNDTIIKNFKALSTKRGVQVQRQGMLQIRRDLESRFESLQQQLKADNEKQIRKITRIVYSGLKERRYKNVRKGIATSRAEKKGKT